MTRNRCSPEKVAPDASFITRVQPTTNLINISADSRKELGVFGEVCAPVQNEHSGKIFRNGIGNFAESIVPPKYQLSLTIANYLYNVHVQLVRLMLIILPTFEAIKLNQRSILLPRQTVTDDRDVCVRQKTTKEGLIPLFKYAISGFPCPCSPMARIVRFSRITAKVNCRRDVRWSIKDLFNPFTIYNLFSCA